MSLQLTRSDILLTVILLSLSYVLRRRSKASGFPKPPGPPGYPLIGNLLDIPNAKQMSDEIWAKWGQKWGEIVSVSVLGTTVVVINSFKQSIEMLEKRGAAFSNRPFLPMPMEVLEMRDSMGLLRYGRALTSRRALFHQELGTESAVRAFHSELERLGKKFLQRLLISPEKALDNCHHYSGSIILSIAYGYEVQDSSSNQYDPMVKIVTTAMDNFNHATVPGAFLVNDIPFLLKLPEWLPGMGWKKLGRIWAKEYWDMIDVPYAFVKRKMMEGTARDSFTSKWLSKNLSELKEFDLKLTASAMFGAGVETTAATIYAFLILMAMHPEIQKKAQVEIQDVVGLGRMPTFEDMKDMTYLHAIFKEVIRYHPAVPNCLPHSNPHDKVHNDMFIPKGAIIFVNLWNMARNPEVYSNPMDFNPSRFLGESPEQDPREVIFGFGRRYVNAASSHFSDLQFLSMMSVRICPGRRLVESVLCITFAMVLASFNISSDAEAPVKFRRNPGIISHLDEMKLRIVPRFDPSHIR
ncbi:hypothetical protein D9758_009759 [Tetrapyrgos nigripes]|uniref:Cytochrome P450 n=1 Tax=Tetrapyrgos nigripes TaxID=182062 RepID=A0A8H5GJZ6_9AGAR|nr:hypothetical protein D9758_009759 [Tetrapyrgos nigripes]